MGRLDLEIQRCRHGSDDSNLSCKFDRVYEDDVKESLAVACMDPSDPPQHMPLLWYLVVRACEMFQVDHHLYPGCDSRSLSLQADTEEVWRKLRCIITNLGLQDIELIQDHLTKDHVAQAVSWYNAEIHNVASIIGGVASEEAVKLITHQYVPLDNTYVFNGIASMAAVYKL
jgi:amyloid beta precursor protein binding protein 1